MDSETINCPYCQRVNEVNAVKCSCGYYFDKAKYREKEEHGNRLYVKNEEYPFLKVIIVILYALGFILIIGGFGILFTYITKENKEEFALSFLDGHWITGISLLITGLFQLGFAEFLKVLINIERNTRTM